MLGYDNSGEVFTLYCCGCHNPAGDDAVEVGRDLYCAACAETLAEQADDGDELKRLPTDFTPAPTFNWSNDNDFR